MAVIAAIAHPSARFNRRLGIPLLVYLGVRSYSIYLWHWPVFALTRPGVDIDAGPVPVFILRVAITLVLADLSFRLIEAPIRSGAIGRWTASWRASQGEERSRRSRRAFLVGALGVTSLVVLTAAIVRAEPSASSDIEESLRAGEDFVASQTTIGARPWQRHGRHGDAGRRGARHRGSVPGRRDPPAGRDDDDRRAAPHPGHRHRRLGHARRGVEARRKRSVRAPTSTPRSPASTRLAIDIVRALKDQGRLGQGVVLHLGNNGPMSAETFRAVMDQLVDVPRVVVVNVRVTRPWEPEVNRVLSEQVPTYPNARLLDWWGESAMHGDWFADDKTHLNAAGANAYALLVAAAMGDVAKQPAPTTTVATVPPADHSPGDGGSHDGRADDDRRTAPGAPLPEGDAAAVARLRSPS